MGKRESQKKFGIKSILDKKLFIELTKKYNIDVMKAMKIIDELNFQKNNTYKLSETRDTTKQKGGFTILIYDKVIIPTTGQPYEKESKKLNLYADGSLRKIEYYDNLPGYPDRSKTGNTLPSIIEWWPNGEKKQEEWFKTNVRHRDNAPAIISYDQSGNIMDQKYFTMGVPKEVIDAGKQQEIEFNKNKAEKDKLEIEKIRKAREDKKQNIQDLYGSQETNPGLPSNQVNHIPQEDWKTQSGDNRINIDFENVHLQNDPESTGQILNKPSGKPKTDLESPDKPKEKKVDKSVYDKVLNYISKFLIKKHKDKLTPELIQKVTDYYTKQREPKESPQVQGHHKKEYTGRKKESSDLSTVEENKLYDDIIQECESMINKLI